LGGQTIIREDAEMTNSHSKLSEMFKKKTVTVGAMAVGVAGLSLALALPANAATIAVAGTGATQVDAGKDAVKRCAESGGSAAGSAVSFAQTSDGSWTATVQCKTP
jgi:hypothetical protein